MGDVIKFRARTSRAGAGPSRKDGPRAIVLTEIERQFLEAFWKALHESGQEAPPELGLSRSMRVVHRAVVSKIYRQSAIPESGDQPVSENTLKSRWRRSTGRLKKFGVIGFAEPFMWNAGLPVQGRPTTPQHQPGGAA